MSWFEYHPRQLIFLRKSNCLGCALLLCVVVCLTLLASFFLPSHLSLKHVSLCSMFHDHSLKLHVRHKIVFTPALKIFERNLGYTSALYISYLHVHHIKLYYSSSIPYFVDTQGIVCLSGAN